jgi:hypothetical protein
VLARQQVQEPVQAVAQPQELALVRELVRELVQAAQPREQ